MRQFEQYGDMVARLYPQPLREDGKRILSQTVTFQVTDDCNLACTYCYQIHKGKRRMSFETAKKFADLLISGEKGFYDYINPEISPAIIIDFIGGEPFLEIDLIDRICDYIMEQLIEKHHPWAMNCMFSICSNGVLYDEPNVQKFLHKWRNRLSFSVTIDGDKALHDSCRVFPDGRPSYDLAVHAAKDWMSHGFYMGSKITIAPGNIVHLYDAIVHMIELGYEEVNANCVYEKGWEPVHGTVLYDQMKKISDYFLDNNIDFEHDFYCSLYNENFFHPKEENDLQNWCFRAGTKVLTPYGNVNIEDLKEGDWVISGSGIPQIVERNMIRYSNNTRLIRIAGMEPLYTTAEHPILCRQYLYKGNRGKLHYSEPKWVNASDLKPGDKVALYKYSFGVMRDVNPNLAYIVGRYIGDGWYSTTGYKICCSYDEADYLEEKLKLANINFSSYDYRTVKQFNIFKNNHELIDILKDAGLYAHGKKVPAPVFTWNKEAIESFLNGYFDADGSYNEQNHMQKFNTVSSILSYDISILIRGLGCHPMTYLNNRAGKHIIEGREVNVRDRYETYFYTDSSRSSRCKYDENLDVIWTTVYSSEECEPYQVYNLTISNDHTFIANGIIVHNCGGNGVMLSCDPDGILFPCLRYMESSLGDDQVPYFIGDVDIGLCQTECDKCRVDCLKKIDRRTQSTDECFYCPIAEGCSWCTAYNYQVFGTPDARATYICIMHKARALGNLYFWNKYYRKNNINKRMKNNVPDEWALEIITQEELDMIKELCKEDDE